MQAEKLLNKSEEIANGKFCVVAQGIRMEEQHSTFGCFHSTELNEDTTVDP